MKPEKEINRYVDDGFDDDFFEDEGTRGQKRNIVEEDNSDFEADRDRSKKRERGREVKDVSDVAETVENAKKNKVLNGLIAGLGIAIVVVGLGIGHHVAKSNNEKTVEPSNNGVGVEYNIDDNIEVEIESYETTEEKRELMESLIGEFCRDGYDQSGMWLDGEKTSDVAFANGEKVFAIAQEVVDAAKEKGVDFTVEQVATIITARNQGEALAAYTAVMTDEAQKVLCDGFVENFEKTDEYQNIRNNSYARPFVDKHLEETASAIIDGDVADIEGAIDHMVDSEAEALNDAFADMIIESNTEETTFTGRYDNAYMAVNKDGRYLGCKAVVDGEVEFDHSNMDLVKTVTNEKDTEGFVVNLKDGDGNSLGVLNIKDACTQPLVEEGRFNAPILPDEEPEPTPVPPTPTPTPTPEPTPPTPTLTPPTPTPTPTPDLTPKNPEAIEANMGVHDESTNDVDVRGVTEQTEAPVFDHEVNVDNSDAAGAAAQQEADAAAEAAGETPVMSQEELASNFAEFLNNH